jgi:hypothetical protein
MSPIKIDADLPNKLRNLQHSVELCDDEGQVVGRFLPILDPKKYGPLEPQVSKEELHRREHANERRYSTVEVLAHLENL